MLKLLQQRRIQQLYGVNARSISEPSLPTPASMQIPNKWGTTGDLQDTTTSRHHSHPPQPPQPRKKSVMFSARVHVVLIPNISEYVAAGLASYLWWTEDEYKVFKQDALHELKSFMSCREISSTKEALRVIYQVGDDPADPADSDSEMGASRKHIDSSSCNALYSSDALEPEKVNFPRVRRILQRFLQYHKQLLEKSLSTSHLDQVHPMALMCSS